MNSAISFFFCHLDATRRLLVFSSRSDFIYAARFLNIVYLQIGQKIMLDALI